MTNTNTDPKSYYDDFSQGYENERGRGYHALIDDLEVSVAEPFARGKRILELGCGTGLILSRLARVASHASGIDVSAGMAEKAKARGLDVRLGSVTELPYESESFDMVYSFKVLAHVPDIELALSEAARVTKPGGHLLLEFYNPWSLRFIAKKIAGPQPISQTRTEADMFTRWDSPRAVERMLPGSLKLEGFRGVRVFTPAAFVHRIPVVASALQRVEHMSVNSPLKVFGGFLIAVIAKR